MLCTRDISDTERHRLKVKGWKMIFNENGNKQTKAKIAILIPDRNRLLKQRLYNKGQKGPRNSISGYLLEETQNTTSERHMHPYAVQFLDIDDYPSYIVSNLIF